ncbi:MAG: glycosyltransferase family 2 protein [Chloroflexi bacterium]|nr:glycosyltransferase family 2 protein [Chloroflexota bacterium]
MNVLGLPRRPLASVVVPTWNGASLLASCLISLAHQTYPNVEVVVADGASTDTSLEVVRSVLPGARFLRLDRNRGFAGNVNAGLRAARGDVLLLLNNDAWANPEWVEASVRSLLSDERRGAVAARMVFEDGRINAAGDGLDRAGRAFQRGAGEPDGPAFDTPALVLGASGGAVAYRRTMLEDVGLFDEWYFAYLEDVDLALRAQLRGWSALYEPAARVVHRGSATGGGPLASYYNARNSIRLLVKTVPSALLPGLLPAILRAQARKAADAAAAWRGAAARATLRGLAAGLWTLPLHLAARRAVQARRTVPPDHVLRMLAERP